MARGLHHLRFVADLHAETDRLRYQFLVSELDLCFTFAEIARTERDAGEHEHAERSLADARKGYDTVGYFLTDPKHTGHLTADQQSRLNERLEQLREAIANVPPPGEGRALMCDENAPG